MITGDEFRDAVARHFARSGWVVCLVFTAGLLAFGGAWLAVETFVPGGTRNGYALGLCMSLVVLLFIVGTVGTWCNVHKSRRDRRLVCKRCDRP